MKIESKKDEKLFISKIWMNVEIFSFIVIFYVGNLASAQI
jgi:hypothetical protein